MNKACHRHCSPLQGWWKKLLDMDRSHPPNQGGHSQNLCGFSSVYHKIRLANICDFSLLGEDLWWVRCPCEHLCQEGQQRSTARQHLLTNEILSRDVDWEIGHLCSGQLLLVRLWELSLSWGLWVEHLRSWGITITLKTTVQPLWTRYAKASFSYNAFGYN